MWPEGQWEAGIWSCDLRANERPKKKLHGKGTNRQTHKQTDMSTLWPTRPRGPSWWKSPKIALKNKKWSISPKISKMSKTYKKLFFSYKILKFWKYFFSYKKMLFFLFCQLRTLVFDQCSPVHPVSDFRWGYPEHDKGWTNGQTEILVSSSCSLGYTVSWRLWTIGSLTESINQLMN